MITLTLPSTASPIDYPNNTVSTYRTKLAEPVRLPATGEYECGLGEIMFPTLIANVRDCWVKVDKGREFGEREYGERKYMEDGFYPDIERFLVSLHTILILPKTQLGLTVNSVTNLVTVHIYSPMRFEMSRKLADILGMDDPVLVSDVATRKDIQGQQAFDLFRGLGHIYVYSDLAIPVALGHTRAPLLRVVNTSITSEPTQRCITFSKIHFVPLSMRNFDRVLVYLRLNSGESVPFMSGACIVTLHIRRRTRTLAGVRY